MGSSNLGAIRAETGWKEGHGTPSSSGVKRTSKLIFSENSFPAAFGDGKHEHFLDCKKGLGKNVCLCVCLSVRWL